MKCDIFIETRLNKYNQNICNEALDTLFRIVYCIFYFIEQCNKTITIYTSKIKYKIKYNVTIEDPTVSN